MKVYVNNLGHMTKMAVMPIYGIKYFKPLKISRTLSPLILKLGMKH